MKEVVNLKTERIVQALMNVRPIELIGNQIRLEPLGQRHFNDLLEVALDEEIWRWTQSQILTPADLRNYIDKALEEQADEISLPFATVDIQTGRAIGSTRFGNIDLFHRRVEIGWTWLGRQWQRTAANTEAKFLMLRHAFETLGCLRVEFKTDSLNERSRNAILRLGAKQEGILRNHMITANGRIRHSVYYSIINSEWPEVMANLTAKLQQTYPQ